MPRTPLSILVASLLGLATISPVFASNADDSPAASSDPVETTTPDPGADADGPEGTEPGEDTAGGDATDEDADGSTAGDDDADAADDSTAGDDDADADDGAAGADDATAGDDDADDSMAGDDDAEAADDADDTTAGDDADDTATGDEDTDSPTTTTTRPRGTSDVECDDPVITRGPAPEIGESVTFDAGDAGVVTLARKSQHELQIVSAEANDGWRADITAKDGERVKVRFTNLSDSKEKIRFAAHMDKAGQELRLRVSHCY